MKTCFRYLLLLLLPVTPLLLAPSLFAAAGFEGRVSLGYKAGKDKEQVVEYAMKEGLVRMEPRMEEAGGGAMIFNWAQQEMIILMPEQMMYMTMPLRSATEQTAGQTPGHEAKVEKTGKTETILGYLCEQYLTTDRGETVEMWVTDKLGNFMGVSTGGGPMGGMMGGGRRQSSGSGWEQAIKGKQGFFPLRVISRDAKGKETFRLEARKVEPGPLPDSLFAPPEGFQKFQMPDMGGMNPFKTG